MKYWKKIQGLAMIFMYVLHHSPTRSFVLPKESHVHLHDQTECMQAVEHFALVQVAFALWIEALLNLKL